MGTWIPPVNTKKLKGFYALSENRAKFEPMLVQQKEASQISEH